MRSSRSTWHITWTWVRTLDMLMWHHYTWKGNLSERFARTNICGSARFWVHQFADSGEQIYFFRDLSRGRELWCQNNENLQFPIPLIRFSHLHSCISRRTSGVNNIGCLGILLKTYISRCVMRQMELPPRSLPYSATALTGKERKGWAWSIRSNEMV